MQIPYLQGWGISRVKSAVRRGQRCQLPGSEQQPSTQITYVTETFPIKLVTQQINKLKPSSWVCIINELIDYPPSQRRLISWNNSGNLVASGLNQAVTLVSGHYTAALELQTLLLLPPKASSIAPLKQQNPDPMLTWNQWDQVKCKCPVPVIPAEHNCSLWNSKNMYEKRIKTNYSWKIHTWNALRL